MLNLGLRVLMWGKKIAIGRLKAEGPGHRWEAEGANTLTQACWNALRQPFASYEVDK